MYLLSLSLALPDEVDCDRMVLDECPWPDVPLPAGAVGEEPVDSCVAVELGEGPLDDLLELPPDPPDLRSLVVEIVAVGVADPEAADRLVPAGRVDMDTVGFVVDPLDAAVTDVVCALVVIALSEADVDAVLW